MVYKEVIGWNLGPSLPVQKFVEFPPPPGIFLDPILWVSGGSVWPVLMIWCTIAKTKTTRNQTKPKPKPKNISHDLSSEILLLRYSRPKDLFRSVVYFEEWQIISTKINPEGVACYAWFVARQVWYETRNIAIRLVLQQCRKTCCMFLLTVLP